MRIATLTLLLCLCGCNEDQPGDDATRAAAYEVCSVGPVYGPWMPDGSCQAALAKQIASIGSCCAKYCNEQPLCEASCIESDSAVIVDALLACPVVEYSSKAPPG